MAEDCGLCEDEGDGYVVLITRFDPACTIHNAAQNLDKARVDAALRKVIEYLDYDVHKQLVCDEETGEDTYSEHVDRFISEYRKAANSA